MIAREQWQVGTIRVLDRVFGERLRQHKQYGNLDFAWATGPEARWLDPVSPLGAADLQRAFRAEYETHEKPTWPHLVREELAEALQEDDPERLAEELLQVAALCVQWVERIEEVL